MKGSWLHRLFVSLLGAILAVSTAVSSAQATDMAIRMAMASGAGVADAGSCPDCDGSGGMTAAGCDAAACAAQVVGALPLSPIAIRIGGQEPAMAVPPALVGWACAPDPHPPRRDPLG